MHELYKIHPQASVAGSVMIALRGHIEKRRGVENRICAGFDNPKSLLIFGKAGTGKTTLMRKVFNKIGETSSDEMIALNHEGEVSAIYHKSAGCSTAAGIRDILKMNGGCIHFFDEMSLNTNQHVHLLKQIGNGEMNWQKHGDIEPFAFDGILVAAANSIKIPDTMEDLLATLERFWIVCAKSTPMSPDEYLDAGLSWHERKEPAVDWDLLCDALSNENYQELNKNEKGMLRKLWRHKCREILDGGNRKQYRNTNSAIDIVRFVKRFTNSDDLTADEELVSFTRAMINDLIHFNPAKLLNLNPAEEKAYDVICENGGVATMQQIRTRCKFLQGGRNAHRALNRLTELGLIYRNGRGSYANVVDEKQVSESMTAKGSSKKKSASRKKYLVTEL